MNWMENWYKTLADHNQGKCDPSECRHCKREIEMRNRTNEAIANAKILYGELKNTIIAEVRADYNGGSDESFVDYITYYDKNKLEIHADETYELSKQSEPWQSWSKQMEAIAWGILGSNFGVGDFSVSGSIVLNVVEGNLYRCREVLATFKEVA